MKSKITLLLSLFMGLHLFIFAQTTEKKKKETKDVPSQAAPEKRKEAMEKLKALDLSPDQQQKMRSANQSLRAERNKIQADSTLTTENKKEKLRSLRMKQLESLREILTPEQMEKFKEMSKKGKNKNEDE